ncbi:calcium-binding protein [Aurantiacibacter poecillastricola]|uniref:calcium-binding protein n=1 Tax=Aurantiacibacter poecillastricola TaxID=3064385 RepID=UPI00273DF627|nr:calcium-binding protein [Aurantiacibacter sp. 219JJ12-13]MDP5261720.1 calcium-binding protein [Aurantiacibacter sp. 219JJ12-13]
MPLINGTNTGEEIYGTEEVDEINGLSGNDSLFGLGGGDTLNGDGGDDLLDGGSGADVLNGGAGWDFVWYERCPSGVVVDIAAGTAEDGYGTTDTLISIEHAVGSMFADRLYGDGGANRLYGLSGADILYGRGGNDELIGAAAADFLYGESGDDILRGGSGNDELDGGSGNDVLSGGSGNDILLGGEGNDVLRGDAGDDRITGGGGYDTVSYSSSPSGVSVDLYSGGYDGFGGFDTFEDVLTGITGSNFRDAIKGDWRDNVLDGLAGDDEIIAREGNDTLRGGDGNDRLHGGVGDDRIFGGAQVDTAVIAGNSADYTVTQTQTGMFEVSGSGGTDVLTGVEYLEFSDTTVRLFPGTGVNVDFQTANPSAYQSSMENIRDFDGNDLGGDGAWLRIGEADVNGDGDIDQILVNDAIGRFATVGTAEDGLVYFDDYGWAGETRVAGIYVDPLVASGEVEAGGPNDSQRRFQNDLEIENINQVLGAGDYDGDGGQEVYFALTDGTAYLHAYMHADGNIQYANYQSQDQVIAYLESNGYNEATYGDWFDNTQASTQSVGSNLALFPDVASTDTMLTTVTDWA